MLPVRGRGPSLLLDDAVLDDTQSAPEQKSAPVLLITTTRRVSSTAASSSVSTIRPMTSTGSEFLRSGRSRRMRRMPSAASMTTPAPCRWCRVAHADATSAPTADAEAGGVGARRPERDGRGPSARFRK